MSIKYDKKNKIFHLHTKEYSYYIAINPLNYLIHLYDGSFLDDVSKERTNERFMERYSFFDGKKENQDEEYYFSMLASKMEIASFGKGDKRGAFAIIESSDGIDLTNFLYIGHKISDYNLTDYNLPHVRFKKTDAKILLIHTKDENRNIYLDLYYIVSEKYQCIIRFSKLINKNDSPIVVKKLSSLELDLSSKEFNILALHGTWSNDDQVEYIKLNHSITKISDNHGARGFYYNPSLALTSIKANENSGEVYGFSYIYSGDFQYEFKVDEIDQTRILLGFNEENFEFKLEDGEELETPQSLIVYSNNGTNKMSQIFHRLINERVTPNNFNNKDRPILLNTWEANHFDITTDKLLKYVDEIKNLGMEMIVLDDGWFGERNNDACGLGDWVVNAEKINLKKVIDYAHSQNIKFGIWIEPEMISFNSDLFKKNPEFALFPTSYKSPTLFRHQLVLDLVSEKARDSVYSQIFKIFKEYQIDYCKWDFNRFITEGYSQILESGHKKETYHRFILGTYDLLNRFNKDFPNVLLETCASGGGRFDLGMLYYSSQIWGSDETDISQRSMIQYSLNMFYPLITIGSHVSSSKTGSIQDKCCLSFFGSFGYELDITKLNEEDKNKIKWFNGIFKQFHKMIIKGKYYSIFNPFLSNYCSFNIVSNNQKECSIYFINYRKETTKARFLKIDGLDDTKYYFNSLTNDIYKGSFYHNVGINISAPLNPYSSMLFILKQVDYPIAKAYRKFKQKDGGKRDKIF